FPVIVLTTPPNAGPDLLRAAAQIAASITLAALSWRYIEEPVRHGAIGRLWARLQRSGASSSSGSGPGWHWRPWAARLGALAAVTAVSAILAVAVAGLADSVRAPAGSSSAALAGAAALPAATKSVTRAGPRPQFVGAAHSPAPAGAGAGSLRSSCRAVAHI